MANNFERQVVTLANFGVDCLVCADEGTIPASALTLSYVIPKGKVITGVILRNMKNNLAGGGNITIKAGATTLGSAFTGSAVKGTSVIQVLETPVVLTADSNIVVTPSSAITAGDLDVIILYV